MGSQKPSLVDADDKTAKLGRRNPRLRSNVGAGKVYTSKGLRGRRLRLSAPTAIQFYDVQDRLGCNRPTEAIDWLLQHAKPAIDALIISRPFETEISQCRKQSFSFPSMAASVPSSSSSQFRCYPLEKFSQKGNFSILNPMSLKATPVQFPGEEPPPCLSQNNVGAGAPSFPMWEYQPP